MTTEVRKGIERALARLSREAGIPLSGLTHACELGDRLFSSLGHIHGLTKTFRPMLSLVCGLRAAESGRTATTLPDARRLAIALERLPSLSRSRIRIIEQALRFSRNDMTPRQVAAEIGHAGGDAAPEVAARMAALVRIVHALDATNTQDVAIESVCDDGRSVRILVSAAPSSARNAEAALAAASLWNALLMRPVGSVAPREGDSGAWRPVYPGDTMAEAGCRILRRQLEQFISREYGLSYREDPEYVHEMRVATRRMRSALRLFGDHLGGLAAELRQNLSAAAAVLGEARDADVFLAFARKYAAQAPRSHQVFLDGLIRAQQHRRARRYRALHEAAGSKPFLYLTRRCHKQLSPDRTSGSAAPEKEGPPKIAAEAPRLLKRRLKKALKVKGPLAGLSVDRLHALRIACKRLRYAGEFLADVYPDRLEPLIDHARNMQELLGNVHDADVFRQRVVQYCRRRADDDREQDALEAVDALLAHLQEWRQTCLQQADRIWARFSRGKRLRQLVKRVDSPCPSHLRAGFAQ